MTIGSKNRLLALVLVTYLILGVIYALTTPVFEASDELWHYPMVEHLANGKSLPVQVFNPDEAGPWKQEASQPPLYYYLGAALTFWIDTTDMEQIRWLNPHVDNGVITADGNINLAIHPDSTDPWQGTMLAVRLVRFFSVLLGAATVYLTYHIAGEVAPGRPEIALGAAALNAYLPMFLFISGSVNNDNLVILLASLALLLMIRIVNHSRPNAGWELGRLILLGIVIGLGALTKITALGMIPLAGSTMFFYQWRISDKQTGVKAISNLLWRATIRLIVVLIPVLLIAGWWYWRNIQLYGDWSGWNAFIAVLGQRAHLASLAQLWDERWGFMMSFWGLFGGLNVPMGNWIYLLLNTIAILAVIGMLIYCLRIVIMWLSTLRKEAKIIPTIVTITLDFVTRYYALLLCLVWSLAVVVGLIRWATVTWSSQGRLVFSAISALLTLMTIGLVGWLPQRPARIIMGSLAMGMFLLSAMVPFLWIQPAYRFNGFNETADLQEINAVFGDQILLSGFWAEVTEIQPGDTLDVYLRWEALKLMEDNWSVFVHLNDPVVDSPVAQRDMYPGQGLLPTRLMTPGLALVNHYRLSVPETVVAPADLDLKVGLYDFFSGERLKRADGSDAIELESLSLRPVPGKVPNSQHVNFENKLALVGFEIQTRRLAAGNRLALTLYWQPSKALGIDYTFFAQVVDVDTTRWASQDIQLPTSSWFEKSVEMVEFVMDVAEDTPPGVYPLIVGVYTRNDEGNFERLQTVTPEGRLTDDFLRLVNIRVD